MQVVDGQRQLWPYTIRSIVMLSAASLGVTVAMACASSQGVAQSQPDQVTASACLKVHFLPQGGAKEWGNYDSVVVALDSIPIARSALDSGPVLESARFRARIFRGGTVGVGTWHQSSADTLFVAFMGGLSLKLDTSDHPFTGRAAFRSDYHLAKEAPEVKLSARAISCERRAD